MLRPPPPVYANVRDGPDTRAAANSCRGSLSEPSPDAGLTLNQLYRAHSEEEIPNWEDDIPLSEEEGDPELYSALIDREPDRVLVRPPQARGCVTTPHIECSP